MEDIEIIDSPEAEFKLNKSFRVFRSLSMIGNLIWGLVFLLLLVGCIANGVELTKSLSADHFFGGVIMFFLIMSAVVVLLCTISIIGLNAMKKGHKKGFRLYATSNCLWVLILFYAATDDGGVLFILGGLISISFIMYFGSLLPKFK